MENLRASPEAPATGLLCLPLEIRLQIYRYCTPHGRLIEVSNLCFDTGWSFEDRVVNHIIDSGVDYLNCNKNKNSIILLSKQISEEALDVLYGNNIFKIDLHGEGEYVFKKNFSQANRQRMRYLLLTAQPGGVSYAPGKMPDNALWCSVLPQLKILRIVAEQPLEAGYYYNAPTLEQDMDCWINWIRPYLQCFGQHLSSQTSVKIDDDGRVETGAIIKECLPGGYREVQCHLAGDFIFKRGRFSWESGYWDDDGPINSRDAGFDWDSD